MNGWGYSNKTFQNRHDEALACITEQIYTGLYISDVRESFTSWDFNYRGLHVEVLKRAEGVLIIIRGVMTSLTDDDCRTPWLFLNKLSFLYDVVNGGSE